MQIAVSAWNVLSYWDQFADIWIVFLDGKILYQHRAGLVLIAPRNVQATIFTNAD
jgi:hypothetical protein